VRSLRSAPPFLSDIDIQSLLNGVDLLPALKAAVRQVRTGSIEVPARIALGAGADGKVTHVMVARDAANSHLVAKLIDYDPSRPSRDGRPSVSGTVTYLSDGQVVFYANASAFTNIRTASTTALAIDLISRPSSGILTVFGAGPLAREHILRIAALRPWTEVRVVSRSGVTAERLAHNLNNVLAGGVYAVKNGASAACDGADVVVTATSALTPILSQQDIRPGTLVAAVGSGTPERRELDGGLVGSAAIVIVETLEAARHEAGDLISAQRDGYFDWQHVISLADLLEDNRKIGSDQLIVYKSVGAAWEDLACARVVAGRLEDNKSREGL